MAALLIAALVADFATMLLITVLVAVISNGLTLDILMIGLLFVGFFLVYRVGNLFFNGCHRCGGQWKSSATPLPRLKYAQLSPSC